MKFDACGCVCLSTKRFSLAFVGARLGGCNGSFALWNDTAGKVPSPIVDDMCTVRPCTAHLDAHCVSPTLVWNGAAGSLEVNMTERKNCEACTSVRKIELAERGCGQAARPL